LLEHDDDEIEEEPDHYEVPVPLASENNTYVESHTYAEPYGNNDGPVYAAIDHADLDNRVNISWRYIQFDFQV
jgi:hypothetical protein